VCHWAQGLGIGPDVPHAVTAPGVTEGNGVGVSKEPPVGTSASAGESDAMAKIKNISFVCDPGELKWDSVQLGRTLLVQMPAELEVEGVKEQMVQVLDYAEDDLMCSHVVVCFKRSRTDRMSLTRMLMLLGFGVVSPSFSLVPAEGRDDYVFMVNSLEDEEEDDEDDTDDSDNA